MPANRQRRDRPGQEASERKLQDVQARGGPFVAAVEATRMPMVVTDPHVADNPIIYANGSFLEMCGYGLEEVLGQNYLFLAGPLTDPELERRVKAAMSARQDLVEEVRFYRKDGRAIWVAAFVSPVTEGGRIVQHFASFIEVTRRVELEGELRQAREALERRVAERTRRLEQANARLEEEVERRRRMEAVLRDTLAQREEDLRYRTFLAREVDHRTKNALQVASSMLQLQAGRTGDPATLEALAAARERLGRMAEVHALLYQGDRPDSVDFAAYLRRLVADLREAMGPEPGQVAVEVDADGATWGPDTVVPLALVVSEAVTNAMKHAFPEERKGTLQVSLRPVGGGLVRLTVEDDGVGLPPSRRQGALGLDLVRVFSEQVRGRAQVEPARGGGTRVTVTFPDPNGG